MKDNIMNNEEFLDCIKRAFVKFLETSSRSNEKLKILHGAIAKDLYQQLGKNYIVQALGHNKGKEGIINGRYINKAVDITILNKDRQLAGIAVKFVMQNYAQNANNYFENMLGETANIQSLHIPYFQIFIIPEKLPYYKQSGKFDKWEYFSSAHRRKYRILSTDDCATWVHTPAKTLLYVIKFPEIGNPENKSDYINKYQELNEANDLNIDAASIAETFGSGLICNDYETFM
jgi:hypothetical protein